MDSDSRRRSRASTAPSTGQVPWLLGALAVVALGHGSGTGQSPTAVTEPLVQPLDALATAGVFAVEAMQLGTDRRAPARTGQEPEPRRPGATGEGTAGVRLWAIVRDARFHREGHLVALLVEPPVVDPRSASVVRVLPAAAVRWDEARSQWVLAQANLQIVELEAATRGLPGATAEKAPAATAVLLASQLVTARFDAGSIGVTPPPVGSERLVSAEHRVPTVWFAPALQRLAVVVVPVSVPRGEDVSARYVPLPWSLVRVTAASDGLQLSLPASVATLVAAPSCADAAERPTASVRKRSYAYFGVAPPAWDRTAAPQETREK